jgi:nitrogen fixation NifU-like protein
MDSLAELYQEVILSHTKRPRHYKVMESPSGFSSGYNPLCGDRVEVYLKISEGKIEEVTFQGECCSICKASASMMCVKCTGKSKEEGLSLLEGFLSQMTVDSNDPEFWKSLGEMQALQGVRQFPARIKCATLAWHALKEAMGGSTE